MAGRRRAGFTLTEALVAGGIFLAIAAAFLFSWSGARREEELASLHLSLMEAASMAMQQVRTDLHGMLVFSHIPAVEGSSFRISRDARSIRLRHSALSLDPAAPFAMIEYGLTPAPSRSGAPRYHLTRTLTTTDGSPLPRLGRPRDEKVFRTFSLADAAFNYLGPRLRPGDPSGDDHVLHVTFQLVSDGGRAGQDDAFAEKTMVLTQVMRFLKPPHPRAVAEPILVAGLEQPPQDVLSEAFVAVPALPAFQE
jgi:type II secretory pathway pseudopilin PulG